MPESAQKRGKKLFKKKWFHNNDSFASISEASQITDKEESNRMRNVKLTKNKKI